MASIIVCMYKASVLHDACFIHSPLTTQSTRQTSDVSTSLHSRHHAEHGAQTTRDGRKQRPLRMPHWHVRVHVWRSAAPHFQRGVNVPLSQALPQEHCRQAPKRPRPAARVIVRSAAADAIKLDNGLPVTGGASRRGSTGHTSIVRLSPLAQLQR